MGWNQSKETAWLWSNSSAVTPRQNFKKYAQYLDEIYKFHYFHMLYTVQKLKQQIQYSNFNNRVTDANEKKHHN